MAAESPRRPRVTQRDIARQAHVSQVTVSLALRGHRSLPRSTCDRIRLIANELGYKPDPALSALAAYRQTGRQAAYRCTLAWLTTYETPEAWRTRATELYYDGASARSSELGYRLENFWLHPPQFTASRLASMLRARNIEGIILPPQARAFSELTFPWDDFAVVSIGSTLRTPSVHTVGSYHFSSMVKLVHELLHLGYERPGLFLAEHMDNRVRHAWSAAFLGETTRLPLRDRIPPYLCEMSAGFDSSAFERWFADTQPDVVVTLHREILTVLRQRNLSIPADVGVAFPTVFNDTAQISGVDENSFKVGASAVDMLSGLLQTNARGLPTVPMRILIEGTWRNGRTTRNKQAQAQMSDAGPDSNRGKSAIVDHL